VEYINFKINKKRLGIMKKISYIVEQIKHKNAFRL